ncbi:nicotinate-nucleotide adenylyltransferase [Brucellaceae bacterium C25G]
MVSASGFSALKNLYPDVSLCDLRMPYVEKGMSVGLFGGSFNPPHAGHVLVAETALRRLKLDQLWWMVTPGSPLKNLSELAPLKDRLTASRQLANDPRIKVTAFEAAYNVRYTADTLAIIQKANPNVRFIWIMGADNLAQFHRWDRWRQIADHIPIAVIDRPNASLTPLTSRMAKTYARYRLNERNAAMLAKHQAPAWVFLHGARSKLSSSALRNS